MMVPPPEQADLDLFPGQLLSDSGLWKTLRFSGTLGWALTCLNFNPRTTCVTGPWASMFITSPPCQEATVELHYECRVKDSRELILKPDFGGAWGVSITRDEGITVACLKNATLNRKCTVLVETKNCSASGVEYRNEHSVSDTTLQDQINRLKDENSGLMVRIGPKSRLSLFSTVAPTAQEYKDMTVHGYLKSPAPGRDKSEDQR
jgi:hypothetical protein